MRLTVSTCTLTSAVINPRQYQINCGSFDFSVPTSGAFDLAIGPYSGEFNQSFFEKSNARGFARGGGGGMIAFGIDPDIRISSFLLQQELRRTAVINNILIF